MTPSSPITGAAYGWSGVPSVVTALAVDGSSAAMTHTLPSLMNTIEPADCAREGPATSTWPKSNASRAATVAAERDTDRDE